MRSWYRWLLASWRCAAWFWSPPQALASILVWCSNGTLFLLVLIYVMVCVRAFRLKNIDQPAWLGYTRLTVDKQWIGGSLALVTLGCPTTPDLLLPWLIQHGVNQHLLLVRKWWFGTWWHCLLHRRLSLKAMKWVMNYDIHIIMKLVQS